MPNKPGPADRKRRAAILERLKAEPGNYDAIAADFKTSTRAIRQWEREAAGEPRSVPPPDAEGGGKGPRYKSSPGRRPITEQTAGMLVSGIFTLIAIVDGESWMLSATERDSLAGPLADSMRTLPTPAADAINTYSAPAMFVSSLATICAHKVRVRKQRKVASATPPLRPVPNQPPPGPQAPPRNPNTTQPFAAQPPAAATVRDPALDAALAAARSNLSSMEVPEEAEAMFS